MPISHGRSVVCSSALTTAHPLAVLKAFHFLPPFLNVPNAVEPGKAHGKDLAWIARLAYELTDTVNVYATYATGFKASSINLSRDSRPLASDLPAIEAAGLTTPNLVGGTRFAGPEESEVYEVGLKGQWSVAALNLAVFKQSIKGFQSNIFTGTGFELANAGKQRSEKRSVVWGKSVELRVDIGGRRNLKKKLTN